MTKKYKLLILSLIVTIGVFIYLSVHHYSIKLGLGGNSLCSVSQTVNCDAAALSSYAEFAGIPVAILGGVFNLFLLGFVLFAWLGWADRSSYFKTTIRGMLIVSAAVSIVMGVLSVAFVNVICPFCVAAYVLSFINLALGWNLFEAEDDEKVNFVAYFGAYKSHLVALAFIPLTAWVISGNVKQTYGLDQVAKVVPEKIRLWQTGIEHDINHQTGISNGNTTAKATIVEYADFKCPHCRDASNTFETLVKANPDVQVILKPFPLDGTCNASDKMTKGDGSRCTLAAWALCGNKLTKRGWEIQKWIFANQERLAGVSDMKSKQPELEKEFQLDSASFTTCVDSAETFAEIRSITEEGIKAQVSGTPTVYLNKKKLPLGHVLEIARSAINEVK